MKQIRFLKRILSFFLILAIVSTCLPASLATVSAEESYEIKKVSFQMMRSGEDGHYVEDGSLEQQNVMIKNSCLLVDLSWIKEKLGLSMDIVENSDNISNRLSNHLKSNSLLKSHYYSEMLEGYTDAFPDKLSGAEFKLSKPESTLSFYLREGSDMAYAYSPYLGNISTKLGAPLTRTANEDGTTTYWVPLVMFLNLFDSFLSTDSGYVCIYPCTQTVVDILHRRNLSDYYFDIFEDAGLSEFEIKGTSIFNNFYRIIKRLFGGIITVNISEISKVFSKEEEFGEIIAKQICTNNADELDQTGKEGSIMTDALSIALSTIVDFSKEVNDVASDDAVYLIEEADRLFENAKSGFNTLDDWNEAAKQAAKAASDAKISSNLYSAFSKAIPIANVALSTYFQYVTLTNEIASTQPSHVKALNTFCQYSEKTENIFSSDEFMSALKDKIQLYDGQKSNIFENEKIMDATVESLANAATSETATVSLSAFSAALLKFQIINLGWNSIESLINETLGSFNALDCLECALYVQMLQIDTDTVLDYYLENEISAENLNTYSELEWMRLMSYYLIRQEVVGIYQAQTRFEKSTSFEFEPEMDELSMLMITLLIGPHGITQSSLDDVYEHCADTNQKLIDSAVISIPLKADQLQWLVEPTWDYEIVEPIPGRSFSDVLPTVNYADGNEPLLEDDVFPFCEMSFPLYSNLPQYYNVKDSNGKWKVFYMPDRVDTGDLEVGKTVRFDANGIFTTLDQNIHDLSSPWNPLLSFAMARGFGDADLYWDEESGQAYFYGGGSYTMYLKKHVEHNLHKPYPVEKIDLSSVKQEIKDDLTIFDWESYPTGPDITTSGPPYAYVDPNGVKITDFLYDKAGDFSDGLAACYRDGKWGYIDETGREVTEFVYDAVWNTDANDASEADKQTMFYYEPSAFPCTDDTMVVQKDGQYGLLYRDGNVLIDFGQFEKMAPSWNNQLWAMQNGKWGLIDLADAKRKAGFAVNEPAEDSLKEKPYHNDSKTLQKNDLSDIPSGAVEFNGHYYYVYNIDTITDWNMAQEYSEAQGGYLATVTSAEEDAFLYSYLINSGYSSAMFGLTDQDTTNVWTWVTGEPFSYENWHSGEPNHQGGYEHYGMYYSKFTDGSWNDGSGAGGPFICEWGEYDRSPLHD
ncbi:lectin-like protein [Solibaculum mannosilyticum]|uniref:lectin-like protein n=1 Tax=Solibaculum mannosilyticum TaxID=2780922 RepID=UPI0034BA4643